MLDRPLLKYACTIEEQNGAALVSYRGREYTFQADGAPVGRLLQLLDGRRGIGEVASEAATDADFVEGLVSDLLAVPLVVEGREVLRDDGALSGAELFWRLEGLLYRWRYDGPRTANGRALEEQVASGGAAEDVVKGFCIEISHQLRNTPTEIAVAIANAPNERVRERFMDFYEEEYEHGGMLMDALATWLSTDGVRSAAPLPTTLGLLNTYNWWAQKDVLLYAVALMRDEQSILDAEIPPERDISGGMQRHYDVPEEVARFFRWHVDFDREEGHGFFPEEVFREYPVIDDDRAASLVNALRLIIDLYDTFYWGIYDYYSRHPVESRWSLGLQLPATPTLAEPPRVSAAHA